MSKDEMKVFENRMSRLYMIASTNYNMVDNKKLQSQHKHELAIHRYDAVVYTYRLLTDDRTSWNEWNEKNEEAWQGEYKELINKGYSE